MTKRAPKLSSLRFLPAIGGVLIASATVAGCASEPAEGGAGSSGVAVSSGYGMGDGFKGYWYTYKDPGGSTISPDCTPTGTCFMGASKICVSGMGAQVVDAMYSTYWGAGVGWNLNQAMSPPNPEMGASLKKKTKVVVEVKMKKVSSLRMKFTVMGDTGEYCANLKPGVNTVPFSDITKDCWVAGGDPMPTDMKVTKLQFQVPTVDAAPTPFDFCIEDLSIN